MSVEERINHASAKRAIERERETRHWTIPQFRDEFGEDWPRGVAGIRAAADEAADWLLTEHSAREEQLSRAIYLARNLLGMVPREVWRDQGGDDMQGHYEGDYYAERVATELEELGATLPATEVAQPKEERRD